MIEFQNVSKAFANKKILDHANFTIKDQEFFVLVGPSGSGKTTTLKMINQLVTHSEGKILINNEEISTANLRKLRLSVGYVLQQIALFPNLTVSENIALIPEMKGWDKAKIADRTNELLDLVGLNPKDYAQRQPSELSGGEQQRVGILRAIAANPKIVLMDEPFSALDPISRRQLQIFIKDLQKKMNLTVVFVTHDLDEALYLADRVAVMNDGLIQQISEPADIYQHPANDFVKTFFKEYRQNLSTVSVENLLLTELSVNPEAQEVADNTAISEIINRLSDKEVLKYKGKSISSDDIICYIAGGDK
ncbi:MULTISPECIES: ABC transporter ATP-binding protein [Lactococcus]|jgi:ABC-type proline/glycine betaine transport systems, ATPase components|uniref:ABC transporter ATP-binding protein n=1 Tax=Lactococcus TaxID=1357 RepID=UPI000494BC37|nr:ABC transporter ATP-binding protein [Lactococcus lactis]MBU5242412.1 ABC transporter ATP-binding protein [Lactococcus lactis]MDN5437838.1 ABC transporter ATP-binding protein [Lactococcus lactis]MDN5440795.1 ABC transporter ATP-binding protein [Lactococcus lactis]MDN5468964.1 ABC transporter ATP-binding protein [Lactococcus lactis]MDN6031076.1 ABC transporter ATP-binding protein [Lactococcus lactis]